MPIAHITKIRGRRQLPVTNKNCDFCVLYCWNPDSKNQYRYLFCVRISMHTLTWEHGLSNFTANCTEKKLFFSQQEFLFELCYRTRSVCGQMARLWERLCEGGNGDGQLGQEPVWALVHKLQRVHHRHTVRTLLVVWIEMDDDQLGWVSLVQNTQTSTINNIG